MVENPRHIPSEQAVRETFSCEYVPAICLFYMSREQDQACPYLPGIVCFKLFANIMNLCEGSFFEMAFKFLLPFTIPWCNYWCYYLLVYLNCWTGYLNFFLTFFFLQILFIGSHSILRRAIVVNVNPNMIWKHERPLLIITFTNQ